MRHKLETSKGLMESAFIDDFDNNMHSLLEGLVLAVKVAIIHMELPFNHLCYESNQAICYEVQRGLNVLDIFGRIHRIREPSA